MRSEIVNNIKLENARLRLYETIVEKLKIPKTNETDVSYIGLDMSGFGRSFFTNMEIISKFKNYLGCGRCVYMPIFWKGSGSIVSIDQCVDPEFKYLDSISGWTTHEIIMQTILLNNPEILEKMVEEVSGSVPEDKGSGLSEFF